MILSTKHRSSIYHSLRPLLGDEEADALLAQFPAAEYDDLVTRQFLRAELAELELRLNHRLAASTAVLSAVISAATAFLTLTS